MRVLFLGAFKGSEFNSQYGDPNDSSLGGQRKMELLLRALILGGHEVRVVSSAVGWKNGWGWQKIASSEHHYPEGSVKVEHALTVRLKPWGGLFVCLSAASKARRLANDWNPELLFAYNGLLPEAFAAMAALRRRTVPFVLEVDDLPGARPRRWNPKPLLDRKLWPVVVRRASGFIFVNAQLRERVPSGDRPVQILPGVIDENLLLRTRQRLRPFTRSQRTMLYAGGLSVDRGAGELLSAIPCLPANWTALVAGAGPLANEFKTLSERLPDKCRYLGLLAPDELYQQLATADVAINTPERLNDNAGVFPFKVIEYLACGAHIVSPRLPALDGPDLGWFQRWNGLAADLPALLLKAEDDFARESEMREKCTQWVSKHFALKAVSSMLTSFMHTCKSSQDFPAKTVS